MAVEGIYKIQALLDLPSFKHSADITRWDIWVPFYHGQASPEQIAHSSFSESLIPPDVMRKHVLLAWKPMKQIWEDGVIERASNVSEMFMKEKLSVNIPLINNNFRQYLLRITAAFSQLMNSYNTTYTKLYVKKEHVDLAEIYMIENIQINEYDMYVKEEKMNYDLADDEISQIVIKMNKNDLKILLELKMDSLQSGIISERLGLAQVTVKNRMKKLKSLNLLTSAKGRSGGYTLTARGIKLLKILSQDTKMSKRIKEKEDIERLSEIQFGKCDKCDTPKVQLTYMYEGSRICEGCAITILNRRRLEI